MSFRGNRRGQEVNSAATIPPIADKPTMPWDSEVPSGPHDTDRLQRSIAVVLKRLYPHNPDVVLGREARNIAEALIADGWTGAER